MTDDERATLERLREEHARRVITSTPNNDVTWLLALCERLAAEVATLEARCESERLWAEKRDAEVAKLQRFKDWVHAYLDGKGVPHHPPGTHGAEGCRIGDRMDWVWADIDRLRRVAEAAREYVCGHHPECYNWDVCTCGREALGSALRDLDAATPLPELTAAERAAMDALPGDFVQRLLRGERPMDDPAVRAAVRKAARTAGDAATPEHRGDKA